MLATWQQAQRTQQQEEVRVTQEATAAATAALRTRFDAWHSEAAWGTGSALSSVALDTAGLGVVVAGFGCFGEAFAYAMAPAADRSTVSRTALAASMWVMLMAGLLCLVRLLVWLLARGENHVRRVGTLQVPSAASCRRFCGAGAGASVGVTQQDAKPMAEALRGLSACAYCRRCSAKGSRGTSAPVLRVLLLLAAFVLPLGALLAWGIESGKVLAMLLWALSTGDPSTCVQVTCVGYDNLSPYMCFPRDTAIIGRGVKFQGVCVGWWTPDVTWTQCGGFLRQQCLLRGGVLTGLGLLLWPTLLALQRCLAACGRRRQRRRQGSANNTTTASPPSASAYRDATQAALSSAGEPPPGPRSWRQLRRHDGGARRTLPAPPSPVSWAAAGVKGDASDGEADDAVTIQLPVSPPSGAAAGRHRAKAPPLQAGYDQLSEPLLHS